jgi:hypothetical protein
MFWDMPISLVDKVESNEQGVFTKKQILRINFLPGNLKW